MLTHTGSFKLRRSQAAKATHMTNMAARYTHTHMRTHTHARTFSPRSAEWMEGATGVVVNTARTHPSPLSLPPFSLTHSRVPLFSHHPLYSKLPPSFPPSFPSFALPKHSQTSLLALSSVTSRCIFPLSFYPHPLSPSLSFSPSPFTLHIFFICSPPYCPLNLRSISHSQFPSSFLLPFPDFSSPFQPLVALFPPSLWLWSLTYLFGADVVVFMRAASPAAAEGRPHNLALVAALGLVRQTDVYGPRPIKTQTN